MGKSTFTVGRDTRAIAAKIARGLVGYGKPQYAGVYAPRLLEMGYLPIPQRAGSDGKVYPSFAYAGKGWLEHPPTLEQFSSAAKGAKCGNWHTDAVGLIAGTPAGEHGGAALQMSVIDVDIADADLASKVEAALVEALGLDRLGVVRRNPVNGKFSVLVRNAGGPSALIAINGVVRRFGDAEDPLAIEIKAANTPITWYGPHRTLHKPYRHDQDEPVAVRADELPVITEAQFWQFCLAVNEFLPPYTGIARKAGARGAAFGGGQIFDGWSYDREGKDAKVVDGYHAFIDHHALLALREEIRVKKCEKDLGRIDALALGKRLGEVLAPLFAEVVGTDARQIERRKKREPREIAKAATAIIRRLIERMKGGKLELSRKSASPTDNQWGMKLLTEEEKAEAIAAGRLIPANDGLDARVARLILKYEWRRIFKEMLEYHDSEIVKNPPAWLLMTTTGLGKTHGLHEVQADFSDALDGLQIYVKIRDDETGEIMRQRGPIALLCATRQMAEQEFAAAERRNPGRAAHVRSKLDTDIHGDPNCFRQEEQRKLLQAGLGHQSVGMCKSSVFNPETGEFEVQKCEYFEECPFQRAKADLSDRLENKSVDLVLMSHQALTLGGMAGVQPCLTIVDEEPTRALNRSATIVLDTFTDERKIPENRRHLDDEKKANGRIQAVFDQRNGVAKEVISYIAGQKPGGFEVQGLVTHLFEKGLREEVAGAMETMRLLATDFDGLKATPNMSMEDLDILIETAKNANSCWAEYHLWKTLHEALKVVAAGGSALPNRQISLIVRTETLKDGGKRKTKLLRVDSTKSIKDQFAGSPVVVLDATSAPDLLYKTFSSHDWQKPIEIYARENVRRVRIGSSVAATSKFVTVTAEDDDDTEGETPETETERAVNRKKANERRAQELAALYRRIVARSKHHEGFAVFGTMKVETALLSHHEELVKAGKNDGILLIRMAEVRQARKLAMADAKRMGFDAEAQERFVKAAGEAHVRDRMIAGGMTRYITIEHYENSTRGSNEWRECTGFYVIGRPQMKPSDLEAIIMGIFGADEAPPERLDKEGDGKARYEMAPTYIQMRNGDVFEKTIPMPSDPRCASVLSQYREASVKQVFGRPRGVGRSDTATIYFEGGLSLDVLWDEMLTLEQAEGEYGEFEQAIVNLNGVLPLSPSLLEGVSERAFGKAMTAKQVSDKLEASNKNSRRITTLLERENGLAGFPLGIASLAWRKDGGARQETHVLFLDLKLDRDAENREILAALRRKLRAILDDQGAEIESLGVLYNPVFARGEGAAPAHTVISDMDVANARHAAKEAAEARAEMIAQREEEKKAARRARDQARYAAKKARAAAEEAAPEKVPVVKLVSTTPQEERVHGGSRKDQKGLSVIGLPPITAPSETAGPVAGAQASRHLRPLSSLPRPVRSKDPSRHATGPAAAVQSVTAAQAIVDPMTVKPADAGPVAAKPVVTEPAVSEKKAAPATPPALGPNGLPLRPLSTLKRPAAQSASL